MCVCVFWCLTFFTACVQVDYRLGFITESPAIMNQPRSNISNQGEVSHLPSGSFHCLPPGSRVRLSTLVQMRKWGEEQGRSSFPQGFCLTGSPHVIHMTDVSCESAKKHWSSSNITQFWQTASKFTHRLFLISVNQIKTQTKPNKNTFIEQNKVFVAHFICLGISQLFPLKAQSQKIARLALHISSSDVFKAD